MSLPLVQFSQIPQYYGIVSQIAPGPYSGPIDLTPQGNAQYVGTGPAFPAITLTGERFYRIRAIITTALPPDDDVTIQWVNASNAQLSLMNKDALLIASVEGVYEAICWWQASTGFPQIKLRIVNAADVTLDAARSYIEIFTLGET